MKPLDVKKDRRTLYSGKAGRVDEVDVPALGYLMIDGKGDPNEAFGPAIGALYAVAFPLKFAIKARDPSKDYVVMPPEALYHAHYERAFELLPRAEWGWTLLIHQPVKPTAKELEAAKARAVAKGVAAAKDVRYETYAEGHCLQALHLGPYATEHETIAAMRAYAASHGLRIAGAHHEVYLSDPRRAKPERMRTILRQPVAAH